MRKYLLPESGYFYKAKLHCHSTYSDGRWTPEEIKKAYMQQGYSVVAYTDHNILIPHHALTDENFLAIMGTEIDIDEDVTRWVHTRAAHWCILAIDPDNDIQPCWHREKYQMQNALAAGDKRVWFMDGKQLMALCKDEGTVDNCHPTDYGFYSMAKAVGDWIEENKILELI